MKYVLILVAIFLGIFLREKDATSAEKEIDTNTTKIERGENMELNTKVKEQWQRLFDFYQNSGLLVKKCEGATEEKITEVEKEFGVTLPKAFADSFRICDERYIFNTYEKKGWFGEDDHYSLSGMFYGYYNLLVTNKEMRIYDEYWKDEWIVFYDYGTWFSAVLDTVTGKIYCHEAETGKYVIWANSYEEWLEMAVDEVVKYGELRLETMEKLLGIE
jgi:cell wall assembly regulator SMI1